MAVITFLLALSLTLYPILSARYDEHHQSQIRVQYQEKVTQANTASLTEARELAGAYNEAIASGVWGSQRFSGDALRLASEDYAGLLNITGSGIMGYVEIPSIGVNLPIRHGTAESTLEAGVGHLLGSSLPVGGPGTHTVLTGHSGMASRKMFSDLDQLAIGDVFYLEVLGERMAYQVDQIRVVLPTDTSLLGIAEGEDYCTLVTCTPFGINSHRLLVRGTRIPYEEAEALAEESAGEETRTPSTWTREYIKGILAGVGTALCIGAALLAVRLYRRCRHSAGNHAK